MSSIDELKQEQPDGIRIDMTGVPTNNDERVAVNLSSEFAEEMSKPEEGIRESYVKDILEGPGSLMDKYIDEKEEEYAERMSTFEQEQELKEQEEEDSEGAVLGFESSFTDSSLDDNEEVGFTETASNIVVDQSDIEDEFVDIANVEEAKPVEVVKKEEKEEVVPPNIDLDVTTVTNDEKIDEEVEDGVVEEENETEDDVLKHLQKLATEKLKPAASKIDLSSFTVLKKPTANIKSLTGEQLKAAKWVLPNQESVVLMKEFLGSELEDLREYSEDGNSLSALSRKFKCIYDHIVSTKPATYEAWLKATPYSDIDHYFFAAYISCFKGVNFLPMDCPDPKCKKTFLTDDIPIMNMVKFENNEIKDKFTEIYKTEASTAGKGIYASEIVPLSNKIAIGFKDASIYSLFEITSLSDKDKDKYSSILDYVPYIDSLYIIHEENGTLEPIGYKVFPENAGKTTRSKINTFYNVLKNLNVDEFGPIKSFVRNVTDKQAKISYVYPSVDCPHCGKTTPEAAMTAEQMLFTRYQISALVTTSLN